MEMFENVADQLNQGCFCLTLNRAGLDAAFVREVEDPTLLELIREGRPHLFSNVSVFLHDGSFAEMARAVRKIEALAELGDVHGRSDHQLCGGAGRDTGRQ